MSDEQPRSSWKYYADKALPHYLFATISAFSLICATNYYLAYTMVIGRVSDVPWNIAVCIGCAYLTLLLYVVRVDYE